MRNYKRTEATEQIAVMNWCKINEFKYPELSLIFHIPNGGSRNKLEAANLKKQGVKAGVPDLFLPVAKSGWNGLFIELKFGTNKVTKSQKEWIHNLEKQGYLCKVCYGAEEAITVLQNYLNTNNFCSKTGKKLHKICPNCWVKDNRAYDCGFETCPGLKLYKLEINHGK